MMEYREELLGSTFRTARSERQRAADLGITAESDEKFLNELIKKRAQEKVDSQGGKLSDYIAGQEYYIKRLKLVTSMPKKDHMQSVYDEMLVDNSTFEELTAMLP